MLFHRVFAFLVALGLLSPALAQRASNQTGIKSHPCLLVNADGLAALRAKAADSTANRFGFKTAEVWAAIKTNADRLAALPAYRYRVDCPGEKYVTLDVFDYTLSDQMPPRHDKSPAYPPWTAMFQEREDSITTRLVHFSFAYLVTGEQKYFDKAKQIALHLAHWQQWTDPSYGAGRLRCCLDTGHCLYAMGMCYDWCYDRLTETERALLREAIAKKGIVPALDGVGAYPADTNGYAVITAGAGLAALAIRPEEPKAGEYLQQCLDKTRVSLDRGGKDGGMFEGPMYGTYLIDSFALFFDALVSAQVTHDLFDHPYLKTMDRYCIGLLAPDTRQIPCFSDGSPGIAVPKLMGLLAQRGSTDAAWYLVQVNAIKPEGIYDFVRFDAGKLSPKQPDWNPSTDFRDIGYASLRDGFNARAPSLFFKSGPEKNRIGHNHYDHNAFVVSYGGQWVIPDRGYHSFYVPEKRKFSLGSLGHCTIVLDVDEAYLHDQKVPSPGHEQVQLAGGKIVDFFAGKRFDFVKGTAGQTYNSTGPKVLDRFDRSIVYLKPHLFVIRDQLSAPQPHRYDFLLHCDAAGDIEAMGDAFLVTRGRAQVYAKVMSSEKLTPHIESYPGAEDYGPYLRVQTEKTPAASFLTVLYPRPYRSDTLLGNGGFEKGLSGWTIREGDDGPNHKMVADDPVEGKQCASLVNSGYYYSQRFELPAGAAITFKAKTRTTELPPGRGATMTIYFWAAGKAFASRRAGPFAGTAWAEHEISAAVPEGTEQVSVAMEFSAPGTAWFDDARVTTSEKVEPMLTPSVKPLDAGSTEITLGRERFLVSFGEPGSPRKIGDLTTDAELAVICLDPGDNPVRALLKGGTFVSYQGRDVIRENGATTAERAMQ
ncbi:MAG: heparinase II/III family protein [Pirellulales bacterium]|nr:heparinase II/III family protein [Pirellulales bacterium]